MRWAAEEGRLLSWVNKGSLFKDAKCSTFIPEKSQTLWITAQVFKIFFLNVGRKGFVLDLLNGSIATVHSKELSNKGLCAITSSERHGGNTGIGLPLARAAGCLHLRLGLDGFYGIPLSGMGRHSSRHKLYPAPFLTVTQHSLQ